MAQSKKKDGFDDIFAPTAESEKPAAKKTKKPAKKTAAKTVAAPAAKNGELPAVLHTAWATHENEFLYRKTKEDKIIFFSVGMLAALVFGAAFVLGAGRALEWHWFGRLIFRLAAAGFVLAIAFAGNALLELNRKRLQDVLAMIVKIQESFCLFEEGCIPGADGAFFPNTYKFVGSLNDDETNYGQMILKVGAAAAIFTTLFII